MTPLQQRPLLMWGGMTEDKETHSLETQGTRQLGRCWMLPGLPKEQWVTVNWESYSWNFICFCSRTFEMEKSSFFWNWLYLRENTSSNQFWRGRETFSELYLEKWCGNSVGKVKHPLLKNNPLLRKNTYSYQLGYFVLWKTKVSLLLYGEYVLYILW